MTNTERTAERRLLCLPLEDLYYGFDLDCVVETLQDVQITRIPCLPSCYCGVCNRKGTITPVVSLDRLVGRPENPTCRHPVIVMVRCGEYECGILTEKQPVILDVSAARAVQEDCGDFSGRCMIREICALEDKLVLVVDAGATLEELVVCK